MRDLIKPKRLCKGDTVGILAPALKVVPERTEPALKKIEELGFCVKRSAHLYSDTLGFAGSVEERASDFNGMIADDEVSMLLFGGGEVSNELLPFIDYENIRRHPKIICSYSDSTTLLNAIHAQTGLVTFYGCSVGTFSRLTDYNLWSFETRLTDPASSEYRPNSEWRVICPGSCRGILTGGYLINFATLQGLQYYPSMPDAPTLLFIEDHETFSNPAMISKWFSHLEQLGVFEHVTGLIFGHYSEKNVPGIDEILFRIGTRHHIPVVRCEDFGHGINNTILPIGISAEFDSVAGFRFCESGVE